MGTELVDARATALPMTELVDRIALDKYLFVRDAYLQRHRKRSDDAIAPIPMADVGREESPRPVVP